jgi:2-phospho-L-lactate/phosphoenolpyruvate guanylyltransferase
MTPRYSIIIPVKPVGVGKSRLRATIAVASPDELVTAIALDTITAALTVADVLVVTNDTGVTEVALALGATVVPDQPDAGLNAAIAHGDAVAGLGPYRAALTADLPALRSADLADALSTFGARSGTGRGYVADHTGMGTTMLLASPGVPLDPCFGPDSAAAHAASGALALDGDWASLRLDVDTAGDLAAARVLGLGKRTAAAL